MNIILPSKFEKSAERIWNFKPRKDDIWIVTYPKCGTTLTQEIMWQIANGIQLDSDESKKFIFLRSPFFEVSMLATSPPPPPGSQSIYVFATISLANYYHNITRKGSFLTDHYRRYSCKRLVRVSMVKVVCVIPKENSNNLNYSLLGFHTQTQVEKLWQAFARISTVTVCQDD